ERRLALKDARFARRLQSAVDNHAQRLARRRDLPHGELRVVGAYGADAGKDGASSGAPAMSVAPRIRAGDPLRSTVTQSGAAIERCRDLEADPRSLARHARDEADVELARLVLEQAVLEGDARRAQGFATARREGIRIAPRHHHPP